MVTPCQSEIGSARAALSLALDDARQAREAQGKAVAAAFFFFPAMFAHLETFRFFRDRARAQLTAANTALGSLETCLNGSSHASCSQAIAELRVDVLAMSGRFGLGDLFDADGLIGDLERVSTLLTNELNGCGFDLTLGPVGTTAESPTIEVTLTVRGLFGPPASPRYAEPADETEREGVTAHTLETSPGSPRGPRFLVLCRTFDVARWTIKAQATLGGFDLAANAPFQFTWRWGDDDVTAASVTQGAISSISVTTPSGKGRVLRVIATSTISGQVVEFAKMVMVPTTREQCQMLPK